MWLGVVAVTFFFNFYPYYRGRTGNPKGGTQEGGREGGGEEKSYKAIAIR